MLIKSFKSVSYAVLVGSLSAGSVFVSSQALAQGEASEIEEVVVSGFRQSLEAALDQKRDAVGSVDAILAEDIAQFPDNNLAESLQRIPGVSIDRAAGEGRNVTVRGMNSTFTRTMVNGMEVTSSSGFTDALGSATNNRTFDFNTFDSDLFRSLTVKKTPDAQTEEGSLGATIELQSARPFDFSEMTLVASGQIGYNDLSEEADPRFAVMYANTFADGMVGILAGLSYSERTVVEEGASSVRWATTGGFPTVRGFTATERPDDFARANGAFKPRLPRYDYYSNEITRTGFNFAVQVAPTDNIEFGLDVLTSKHEAERDERFIQGIMNNGGVNGGSDLADFDIDNTNTMLFGSVTNGRIHTESRRDELETDFSVITGYFNIDFSDTFRMNALVGTSESEFNNPVQTSINLQRDGVDWSWDYRDGRVPAFDFSAASTDSSGWTTNSFRLRPQGVENTFDTVKLDFEVDLNDALSLDFGVSTKTFEFNQFESRRGIENDPLDPDDTRPADPENGTNGPLTFEVPANLVTSLDGGSATWATVDFDAYLAFLTAPGTFTNTDPFAVAPRTANIWSVEEETTSLYAQLNFETSIGEVPLRGNIGFRSIDTDQTSTSFGAGAASDTLITATHSYDELLPSLNLVWEMSEDVLVRFSWATVISRAGLGSLRPNPNVSVSGGARTITSGNPFLEPTKAKTFDLAVEYYFAEESLLSMAVFHKDIETFAQTFGQTLLFNETGLNIPAQDGIDACADANQTTDVCNTTTAEWEFRVPVNAPGGDLYGFEVGYQQPFTFLPGFWSNFGVLGNFTYVDAALDYINNSGVVIDTQNFLGLSQTASNATLYYEDEAFMARLSFANRAGYLTQVPGRNANNLEGVHATNHVDFSASYSLSDQLKLSFEALNLTDQADDHWVDKSGDRPSFYHTSGTQYYFGVRFSL